MKSEAKTVDEYLDSLPEERQAAMRKLRKTILDNLPEGFSEEMSYGMIGYVVPHSIYPKGYHCNPKLPLPFINLGSQKTAISLHHMGIYANEKLLKWFTDEYPKHSKTKPEMGKGCIRFKKLEQIPYDLVAELARKIAVEDWVSMCEKTFTKNR